MNVSQIRKNKGFPYLFLFLFVFLFLLAVSPRILLLHPQFRFLYQRPEPIQIRLDQLVVFNILRRDQQLDLQRTKLWFLQSSTSLWEAAAPVTVCVHLFESVQNLLSLTEVSEEKLQGPRNQRSIVVHDEMDQHPEEHSASFVVHLKDAVAFTVHTDAWGHTHTQRLSQDCWHRFSMLSNEKKEDESKFRRLK